MNTTTQPTTLYAKHIADATVLKFKPLTPAQYVRIVSKLLRSA